MKIRLLILALALGGCVQHGNLAMSEHQGVAKPKQVRALRSPPDVQPLRRGRETARENPKPALRPSIAPES